MAAVKLDELEEVKVGKDGLIEGGQPGWFFTIIPVKGSRHLWVALVQGGTLESLASATDVWTAKKGFNDTHHTLTFAEQEYERCRRILLDMGYRVGQLVNWA